MDAILERARELKQALIQFVLDAEGDLAESLETYTAKQSSSQRFDAVQRNLVLDTFLSEGQVGTQTPLELFIASHPDLSPSDRQLLNSWHSSFIGLFEVQQILPDGFELMNWLSAKHYTVKPNDPQTLAEMARFKLGEILLTRVAPVTETDWMFSGPCVPMGRLGKPKLAVAIGNFKDNHKQHLYSDAPDLLEEAWQSVAQYHQDFVDFFGGDELTLSGYELSKKIAEFQEVTTQKRLAAAGIDESKSLAELAEEAGVDDAELEEMALETGADTNAIAQVLANKGTLKMMMPKVELPAELKKAEQVTVLAHPRWGQMLLPTHKKFQTLLEAEDWQSVPGATNLVRHYLEDDAINAFVWRRLAEAYPSQLETVLQGVLERPDFKLDRDLDPLLEAHGKTLEPVLPEIASVPIHLHNLFQEAVAEVQKSKPKSKGKKKPTKGFQRA